MGDYRKTIDKRLRRAHWGFNSHNSEQNERSLAKAAEYFELDPKNPHHRERLLYKLADVVFGPPGKKGRPCGSTTSWGSSPRGNRVLRLGEIYTYKKRDNPMLSDAKIAQLIKAEHEEFKNDDVEQIRQRLTKAHQQYEDWKFEHWEPELPDDWEPEDYSGSDDG